MFSRSTNNAASPVMSPVTDILPITVGRPRGRVAYSVVKVRDAVPAPSITSSDGAPQGRPSRRILGKPTAPFLSRLRPKAGQAAPRVRRMRLPSSDTTSGGPPMSYMRLTLAHPGPERREEVLKHYEELVSYVLTLPGCIGGYVLEAKDQ